MTRKLPPTASIAEPAQGDMLFAPSAARNAEALCDVILRHAPKAGRALEIASGTGQHVVVYAQAMPDIVWQPTEIDAARRASIDAYVAHTGLNNVKQAQTLDALSPGWAKDQSAYDLITLANLSHLISEPEAQILISEIAAALAPKGTFVLYGPFARDGALTSAGDVQFDEELRAADPAIGYKDTKQITTWCTAAQLSVEKIEEMPANNLALIARKL